MQLIRRTRRPFAVLAAAAAAALVLPTGAAAEDASPVAPLTDPQALSDIAAMFPDDARMPTTDELAAVQALFPAFIGTLIQPAAGTPNNAMLAQAQALVDQSPLPQDVKDKLGAAIAFLDGSKGGGPEIPEGGDKPVIQQFLFPTVGQGCIAGGQDSVGMALMTAGPQPAPAPGPGPGQAGFVFTALGTSGAQPAPAQQLMVSWINVDTGAQGTQPLTNESGINQDGPTTLTTIADTGTGRVVSTIYGSVVSKGEDGAPPIECTVLPTIGLGVV
ncbi:hypothetical protein [Tomitella fengzijianii]|uniref:Rv1157c family protein n=1 Tax=Tomitella fengzijianii TaxID=2597660 RepID=UPI001E50B7BA|nr:hypothetical protein [Tomitella fengzijianii]